MFTGIHDSILVAYSVDSESRELTLRLRPEGGGASNEFLVVFRGTSAHRFDAPLVPAILFDICPQDAKDLLREEWTAIENRRAESGWPGSWADSLSVAIQFAETEGLRGFRIESSYGLSGWVLAVSAELVGSRSNDKDREVSHPASSAPTNSESKRGIETQSADIIAGADGCRGGWLCLVLEGDGASVAGFIVESFSALLLHLPESAVLAIDIPIGLPSRGSRNCDLEARRRLGPRASSVFPSPIRPVLDAATYRDACTARGAVDGKGMSQQAFGILSKVREVDTELRRSTSRCTVRECHPEVSFAVWAGQPMLYPKKVGLGRDERAAMIDAVWPGARASVAATLPRGKYAVDDLHDAFAALWTARRIRQGSALKLPTELESQVDEHGIRMEIVA